jgi:VWFA-related protein
MLFSAIAAPRALRGSAFAQTIAVPEELNGLNDPDKDLAFSTGVRVVNILATVRDKHDKVVHGLTKEDFLLRENGRPQDIQYFGLQSDLPLIVGLVIDLSGSVHQFVDEERTAAHGFLSQVLRPQDQAFLVTFGSKVWLNQPPTSSLSDLDHALAISGRFGGSTKLYDAVKGSSDQILRRKPGRKAVIVLSDGDDIVSKFTLSSAIEAAQRADALVYTLQLPGGTLAATRALKKMAGETGGRRFKFNLGRLAETFAEIEEELRNQYLLGFEPPAAATGFRSINLLAKDSHLTVQARTRYYLE